MQTRLFKWLILKVVNTLRSFEQSELERKFSFVLLLVLFSGGGWGISSSVDYVRGNFFYWHMRHNETKDLEQNPRSDQLFNSPFGLRVNSP